MRKYTVTSYVTVCVKSHVIEAASPEEAKDKFDKSLHQEKGLKSALCDCLDTSNPSPVVANTQYADEVVGYLVDELDTSGHAIDETFFSEAPETTQNLSQLIADSMKKYGPLVATVEDGDLESLESPDPALAGLDYIIIDNNVTQDDETLYDHGVSETYSEHIGTS